MAARAVIPTSSDTTVVRARVGSVVRRAVAGCAVAMAWCALVPAGPPASAAVTPTASQCADETSLWTGDATVTPGGAALDTGTDVGAAGAGVELTVVGVSADGLDADGRARPLVVQVGGVTAGAGAALTGGRIRVVHPSDGSGPLRVVGVSVVVRRCTLVSSAPAGPATPVAAASPPAGSPVGSPANASQAATPVAGALLPETGGAPWSRSLVGSLLVGAGVAMVTFGRRRATAQVPGPAPSVTAGGLEPGSPLGARPHAPH